MTDTQIHIHTIFTLQQEELNQHTIFGILRL